jgi:hypothetical protein
MVDRTLRLNGGPDTVSDHIFFSLFIQPYIILDVGLAYTKCGFSKEALPIHVIPTPLSMIHQIRDNLNTVNSATFASAFSNLKKLRLELEEFLNYIFYQ